MIDKNLIIFIRNFINKELLKRTLLPHKNTIYIDGSNRLYGGRLLEALFFGKNKLLNIAKYAVFIDEDCLIYDENIIFDIINYMDLYKFDMYGCPDGGHIMRTHRDDIPNLFFFICNIEKLKTLNAQDYLQYMIPLIWVSGIDMVKYDDFEPYYKMLCYMRYKLHMKYLPAKYYYVDSEYEIANGSIKLQPTHLTWNNQDFAIHTWYARLYNRSILYTKYIDKYIPKINNKNKFI